MAMSMGMLERYDDALSAFWAAYRLAGSNRRRQSMALGALGQLLLDAGYPRAARAAFSSGIARTSEIFPRAAALGGYAIASAVLEDTAGVAFAVAETSTLARLRGAPWEIVSTMLECSDALEMIGKRSAAATLRRRALRLAQRQGYHQLVYLAEHSKRRGLAARFQRPITPGSREIVHLVETMGSPGLPMLVNGG
jgi:tetratricopeptide (TPR) repeat protein